MPPVVGAAHAAPASIDPEPATDPEVAPDALLPDPAEPELDTPELDEPDAAEPEAEDPELEDPEPAPEPAAPEPAAPEPEALAPEDPEPPPPSPAKGGLEVLEHAAALAKQASTAKAYGGAVRNGIGMGILLL
ncbi:MAG: hypothetical protein M3O50_14175 [Myxococcota bacterium]|nr:hypothetical protein [Myxococcota bacterium]